MALHWFANEFSMTEHKTIGTFLLHASEEIHLFENEDYAHREENGAHIKPSSDSRVKQTQVSMYMNRKGWRQKGVNFDVVNLSNCLSTIVIYELQDCYIKSRS
ncbi:hypothetical protein WA026_015233 [Henosepilachna vigintioctopunctata]|uniref:Uncharacterized protein n=1 Tax=Henosepilachna vigintioctopunctata TaxID=420089 RepID=A0AAW1TNX1_9CUCU